MSCRALSLFRVRTTRPWTGRVRARGRSSIQMPPSARVVPKRALITPVYLSVRSAWTKSGLANTSANKTSLRMAEELGLEKIRGQGAAIEVGRTFSALDDQIVAKAQRMRRLTIPA